MCHIGSGSGSGSGGGGGGGGAHLGAALRMTAAPLQHVVLVDNALSTRFCKALLTGQAPGGGGGRGGGGSSRGGDKPAADGGGGNSDDGIGGATAAAAAAAAAAVAERRRPVALRTLLLKNNKIDSKGAACIAQLLRQQGAPDLVELDLSFNRIGPSGGAALAKALSAPGCGLQALSLSFNPLGTAAVLELIEATEHGSSQEELRVVTPLRRLSVQGTGRPADSEFMAPGERRQMLWESTVEIARRLSGGGSRGGDGGWSSSRRATEVVLEDGGGGGGGAGRGAGGGRGTGGVGGGKLRIYDEGEAKKRRGRWEAWQSLADGP
eukprot:g3516.t1